jgi:transposase
VLEEIVLPTRWEVQLDRYEVEKDGGGLFLQAHITTIKSECPSCGFTSGRVHSRYVRHPADLPIAGHNVEFSLTVRRFFCDNSECSKRTFAEQVPVLLAPKARRTTRQSCFLKELAFALGGKPGARLALKQGIKVGRDTLLRLIRKTPVPDYATPRILGVDDWSYRKGVEFGTILVDLEEHRPVDLLVDRKAETLVKWLEKHPGVEIISRDRASSYADGARRGAPQAIQVADKFHLVKNLGEHLKNMFERKNACLLTPLKGSVSQEMLIQPEGVSLEVEKVAEEISINEAGLACDLTLVECKEEIQEKQIEEAPVQPVEFTSRKHYLFEHIRALNTEGLSQRGIAIELRISRHTVKKYLHSEKVPRYTPRPSRPSKLDLYKPYIAARWREGVYKGVRLFLEIRERGYSGSWALLGQYLAKFRRDNPVPKPQKAGPGRPPGSGSVGSTTKGTVINRKLKPQPMLSAREAVWVVLKRAEDLTEKQQKLLAHLRAFDTEVEMAYQLSLEFVQMVRERQGHKLEEWLLAVEQQVQQAQLMELGSFANGIKQDYAAVKAGLTLEVSQGQVEGQVNRLKTIKRDMFGRGKFELLKARVLHRNVA